MQSGHISASQLSQPINSEHSTHSNELQRLQTPPQPQVQQAINLHTTKAHGQAMHGACVAVKT